MEETVRKIGVVNDAGISKTMMLEGSHGNHRERGEYPDVLILGGLPVLSSYNLSCATNDDITGEPMTIGPPPAWVVRTSNTRLRGRGKNATGTGKPACTEHSFDAWR